jgi:hypothetical protein
MDARLAPGGGDPGVPTALLQVVTELLQRVSPERVEHLWIFPPLRRGRREHGLVSAGCLPEPGEGGARPGEGGARSAEGRDPPEFRRLLVTLSYRAEETGKGIQLHSRFQEEGEAPADRLPRVMRGVVRRAEAGPGDPVLVEGAGDPERLAAELARLGLAWAPPAVTGAAGPGPDEQDATERSHRLDQGRRE